MKIYKFLLEHFTDEQRFHMTSKICLDILGRHVVLGIKCLFASGPAGLEPVGPAPPGRPLLSGTHLCPRSPGSRRALWLCAPPHRGRCLRSWSLYPLPACFADGVLPPDGEASELLSDAFEVLSSKEIKLLAMRSKPDKDLLMEEDDVALANVVMQEAQKKLISQVSAPRRPPCPAVWVAWGLPPSSAGALMLPDGAHAPTSLVSGNPSHLPAWMCHRHLGLPVLTYLPPLFLLLVTLFPQSPVVERAWRCPGRRLHARHGFLRPQWGLSHVRGGWLSSLSPGPRLWFLACFPFPTRALKTPEPTEIDCPHAMCRSSQLHLSRVPGSVYVSLCPF